MTKVKIEKIDDKTISVECPYHPDAIDMFRTTGGKFNKLWIFDARDEDRVKDILVDVFGTHDSEQCETIDIQMAFEEDDYAAKEALYYAGRQVARAMGRDSGAKLGDGVVVIEGRAPRSGGSAKNWTTVISAGTVLEIRDIPKPAADELINNPPEGVVVSLVRGASISMESLQLRRAELLSELADTESLIASKEAESKLDEQEEMDCEMGM
ncbi:hypothetical protein KG088_17230 [Halomonas sp. TRM85114]|uniref:hypothetical protein n=1 Tax=Halomonas jincaotanensis TaxID=2810616 RepID=UPI001BD42678|nr:hypothetical protein [Halomonas jincaotanensis]MBS9405356.1 hypothetical protein [Halomonas jincaotanensis]